MRVSVRLSEETMQAIEKIKEFMDHKPEYDGLRLTNGTVVNNVFEAVKMPVDWEQTLKHKPIYFNRKNYNLKDTKTNLTLNKETINKIDLYKGELPSFTGTAYVTTPYVIRMVLRAYIIENEIA